MATINMNEQLSNRVSRRGIFGFRSLAVVAALTLGACATQPPVVRSAPPAEPLPSTQVYFYPTKGQSPAQQDRDRYECYSWASQQTGFDPSQPQLPPHQRVEVVPQPPVGQSTASGAVTGAFLGAVVSHPSRSLEGALFGAIAGTIIGAASDVARQNQATRLQEEYDRRTAQAAARTEQQASAYRRAMGTCLEGRGYTVN
jgi:Glycine zipper 2TM domain